MDCHQSILGLAMGGTLLVAAPPVAYGMDPPTAPIPWTLKLSIPALDSHPWPASAIGSQGIPGEHTGSHSSLKLAGSATVEVWGNEPQEALNLLQKRLNPELIQAFQAGWSCNVSAQIFGEVLAMANSGQEIKAPTTPPVFYNCMRPRGADDKLQALLAYTAISLP